MNKTSYLCSLLKISLSYRGRHIILSESMKGYACYSGHVYRFQSGKGRRETALYRVKPQYLYFPHNPYLTQGSSHLRSRHTTKQSIWDFRGRDPSLLRWGEPVRTHVAVFSVSAKTTLVFPRRKGLVRWATGSTLAAFRLEERNEDLLIKEREVRESEGPLAQQLSLET